MLNFLDEDGISIEYMYAFSVGEDASIILKTEDCKKSIESLKSHQMELLSASEIYQI